MGRVVLGNTLHAVFGGFLGEAIAVVAGVIALIAVGLAELTVFLVSRVLRTLRRNDGNPHDGDR